MDGVAHGMGLRVLACTTAFMLVVAGVSVQGMDLVLTIEQSLDGHLSFFTLDNRALQSFAIRWENIGSVNCMTRPRIDIYSPGAGLVHTAWGSQERIMAGQGHEWVLHSGLEEGDYSAILRVYFCNEILEEEPFNFSVQEKATPGGLSIDSVRVYKDYVEVSVRSPDGANGVAVIPEDYPTGWIFESGISGDLKPGETGLARLGYVPVRLAGTAIGIRALSAEGYSVGREFSMPALQEEPAIDWGLVMGLAFAFAVIIIVALYLSRIIFKIWRRQ
jgi:hypothetical protein